MKFRVFALAAAVLLVCPRPAPAQEVPEPARPYLEDAERLKAAGKGDDAVKSYRRAIDAAPDWVASFVSLGALLSEQGKADEALAVFEAGLKTSPKDQTLLFNAAAVSLKLGRFPVALGYADRALAVSPKEPSLHLLRGGVLRKMARSDDALAAYREAARLDSRSASTQFNLGSLYAELGKREEAAEAFKAAFERDPTMLKAQYNLGAVLYELGRDEEAIKAYEAALAPIDKELGKGKPVEWIHARAFANLGALYLRRREWQKSLAVYEKAVRIDARTDRHEYDLGYLHYQLGHEEKAAELYAQALLRNKALPLAHLHLGLIAEKKGLIAAARTSFEAALPLADKDAKREAYLALARLAEKAGQPAGAEAPLRAVLKDFPEDGPTLLALGRLERKQSRLPDAGATLERARKVMPESGAVIREQAVLARAEGDPAREKMLYEELLARAGRPEELWAVRLRLASLAMSSAKGAREKGDTGPSESRRVLEAALAHVPPAQADAARTLRALLALCVASEGRKEEAAQALAKVSVEKPGDGAPRLAAAALDAVAGRSQPARAGLARSASSADGSAAERDARASIDRYRDANLALLSWAAGKTPTDADVALFRWAYPTWWGVNLAEAERALEKKDDRTAARKLASALEACTPGSSAAAASLPPVPGVFSVVVGGE
ncbi:MAG: tetratricopeptide repeat protein, partial [Thermoanaerobaculia bacterium]